MDKSLVSCFFIDHGVVVVVVLVAVAAVTKTTPRPKTSCSIKQLNITQLKNAYAVNRYKKGIKAKFVKVCK